MNQVIVMTATNTSFLATTRTKTQEEIQFLNVIDSMITLTREEKEAILENIQIRTYKKGDFLLKEGEIAHECFLNLKGCVRQFYLVNGEERTTNFFIEGESISSTRSNINKVPANHYLECIEDTTVSVGTPEKEEDLYRRFPRLESVCRIEVEKKLGEYEEMHAAYLMTTPEERYLNLMESRPELLTRVPQYQLASYIGVKPESLSRIRRRIALK